MMVVGRGMETGVNVVVVVAVGGWCCISRSTSNAAVLYDNVMWFPPLWS